jgi:hypothetical protein
LLNCWRIVCAAEVREVEAMEGLAAVSQRVAGGDLSPLFDRHTYPGLLAVAEALPAGEDWPAEDPGDEGTDPRLVVGPLWSTTPIPFAAGDGLLAALRSRSVPSLVSVTGLEAVGSERVPPLPLRDGVVVAPGDDPVVEAVRMRETAKATSNERLATQLRVVVNAASWGLFAQLNWFKVSGGHRQRLRVVERPGKRTWPPIAAAVPAVVRMWLALLDRLVGDAGGMILTRDTDGAAIVSAPTSGKIELPDGRIVKVLSWDEVDAILACFDALDPFGDGRPFWKVTR